MRPLTNLMLHLGKGDWRALRNDFPWYSPKGHTGNRKIHLALILRKQFAIAPFWAIFRLADADTLPRAKPKCGVRDDRSHCALERNLLSLLSTASSGAGNPASVVVFVAGVENDILEASAVPAVVISAYTSGSKRQ